MARPGIMVYFEMRDAMRCLRPEDRGELIMAMLDYGKEGTVPSFESATLSPLWTLVKERLDHDNARYQNTLHQREYAAFCRKRTALSLPKISMDHWELMDEGSRMAAVMPELNGSYTAD